MATSVTQFGVTFHFSADAEVGQFASGDYWVVAPVVIARIEPDFDSGNNGWQVNPAVSGTQGLQACSGPYNVGYDASLMPALPYTASAGQSILKVIAAANTSVATSIVDRAVVLTVLASAPAGGGAGFFRPPYVGTEKPLYNVANLRTDLLPARTPPAGTVPTLAAVQAAWSKGVRMDHHTVNPRALRPKLTFPDDYSPALGPEIYDGMLRLMLNDPVEDKLPALIAYTQHAIDRAYTVMGGYRAGNSGHNPNHTIQAAWAAVMLDIQVVKDYLSTATGFQEDSIITKLGDRPLFGQVNTEAAYWNFIMGTGGNRSNRDPYGIIDGGKQSVTASEYQFITAQCHKGQVLASNLMPGLQCAYTPTFWPIIKEYAERWVNHGVWASPDPYAPFDGNVANYGITYGADPADPGDGIHGSGRFTQFHGAAKDGGQYKSAFVAAMWTEHAGPLPPVGAAASAAVSAVAVSWASESTDELGFRIERSLNGSTGWTEVATVGAGVTEYIDTGLAPGTTYHYRVRAYNNSGNSAYSNTALATTGTPPVLGGGNVAAPSAALLMRY